MIWRFFSVLVFALTAIVMAYLYLFTPEDKLMSDLEYKPSIAYLLQPTENIEFSLPMGLQKIRITSRLGQSNMDSPPTWWQGYTFHLRWKNAEGEIVHEQDYHERTRISRFPSPEAEPYRRAFLAGYTEPLPDARITIVAGDALLPEGGSLEISLPENSPPLYFNATGEQVRSDIEAQQRILSLTSYQKDKLVRRLGIISWSMLDVDEQWSLVKHEWRALAPKGQINRDFKSSWIMQSDFELPWAYPQLMGTTLNPQRALALNLNGPITLRVSGPKEILDLNATIVEDAADEANELVVEWLPDTPIGLSQEEQAFAVAINHEGPVSLHLQNGTEGDVGPVIFSVDNPKPEDFFGWTLGAMLRDLIPNNALQKRNTAIIAPEWWYAEYYESGDLPIRIQPPKSDENSEIIVDIRAHLNSPTDTTERSLTIIGLSADGERVWSRSFAFEPLPAPYEYYRPDTPNRSLSTWVSQRERVYVPYNSEVNEIHLVSEDRLLLVPQTIGPPVGDDSTYVLPNGTTLLRFPRFAYTAYHRLEAINAIELDNADQLVKIASNTRLEPYPETRAKRLDKAVYTPVILEQLPQQWLVQTKDMQHPGPTYCRIRANETQSFTWNADSRQKLRSIIETTVVASSPKSLGSQYTISINGKDLVSDQFVQEVERHRPFVPYNIEAIQFKAAKGSTAWLRQFGSPIKQCQTPRRSIGYWPLRPGEKRIVQITKDKIMQRLLVTGLGKTDGGLSLVINDGVEIPNSEIHQGWTERAHMLKMPRTQRPVAYQLRTPNVSAGILEARSILLKQDLEFGEHQIELKNIGDSTLYLRLHLETDQRPDYTSGQQQWSLAELD